MITSIPFKAVIALFAAVAAARQTSHVADQLSSIPFGWEKRAAPDPSTGLEFWLSVRRDNTQLLRETLRDISTPGHARYGKHMTRDELKDMVRPAADTTSKITNWLETGGVLPQDIMNDGDWIKFNANVQTAENLLATRFHHYEERLTGRSKIRTLEYSLPESVAGHIRMIQPTTLFGHIRPQRSLIFESFTENSDLNAKTAATECTDMFTPACLRELYGLGDRVASPDRDNRLGVSGYLEQYAQYDDLELFLEKYADYAKDANFSVALIGDGKNIQGSRKDSGEANLDIQYAIALSYNTNVTYYSAGGRGPLVPDMSQPNKDSNSNEPYLDQLRYLVNLPDDQIPTVLTTSYGETEQSLPREYMEETCELFAQLGVRGMSIIFSSGDTGPGTSCQKNDGKNTTAFNPIYPASCPYVTSIGGTHKQNPEEAISFSSGGFSETFDRPSYQTKAVEEYLEILGDRWKGLYVRSGRGFPDIAAQGKNYAVYDKGTLKRISGTSASAPTIAGIISQLNDIQLSKGKSTLGFLNPWIYSKAHKAFTDIVDGGSKGCTGRDMYSGLETTLIPYASWNATKGWDPVTGFGTPNFKKLVELLP